MEIVIGTLTRPISTRPVLLYFFLLGTGVQKGQGTGTRIPPCLLFLLFVHTARVECWAKQRRHANQDRGKARLWDDSCGDVASFLVKRAQFQGHGSFYHLLFLKGLALKWEARSTNASLTGPRWLRQERRVDCIGYGDDQRLFAVQGR